MKDTDKKPEHVTKPFCFAAPNFKVKTEAKKQNKGMISLAREIVMVDSLLVATTSLYLIDYFLKVEVKQYKVNMVKIEKLTSDSITTDRIEDLLVPRERNAPDDIKIVSKHRLILTEDSLLKEQFKALRQHMMLENPNANRERHAECH